VHENKHIYLSLEASKMTETPLPFSPQYAPRTEGKTQARVWNKMHHF